MSTDAALEARRRRPKSRKWETELIEIIDETPDVRTFRFDKPKDWTFIPGQYVMVFFPEVFGRKNRAYSIASSPNSEYIDLTIKLYGLFTHHMWTLNVGSSWTLRGPYGHFVLDQKRNNDVLLLGAGVGVTPLMSMIRWATEVKSDRRFLLLYSNKKPKDIIFLKELQAMERMNPNIQVVYTLTRLQDKLRDSWPGLTGRIDAEMIKAEVTKWKTEGSENPTSLSCGPVPMLNTVEQVLTEIGWPKEEIKYEKFW
ncbi:MAG: ferredoxin--NADP reductase [Candidatus Kariarchaeaceae archaeon]|jgi:ferredoxin-NADP reductase